MGLGLSRNTRGLSAYDPDAQAFFTATGITNPTTKAAVNFRVRSFKGLDTTYNAPAYNLWAMIPADYPLVGGTATTNKYNLKDPQNTDGAYRITFTGSGTHTTGYVSNGVNGSGNTHITPADLGQNTGGYYFYSRTAGSEIKQSFTVQTGGSDEFGIYRRYSDNNAYVACNSGEQTRANSDGSGFFVVSRSAANLFNIMIRGTNSTSVLASAAPAAFNITISAKNLSGVISQFSVTNFASFGVMNQTFSENQLAVLTAIDVQFQTMLSRNV
jgi:hypothetical protein